MSNTSNTIRLDGLGRRDLETKLTQAVKERDELQQLANRLEVIAKDHRHASEVALEQLQMVENVNAQLLEQFAALKRDARRDAHAAVLQQIASGLSIANRHLSASPWFVFRYARAVDALQRLFDIVTRGIR